jgi:hypothetical protein
MKPPIDVSVIKVAMLPVGSSFVSAQSQGFVKQWKTDVLPVDSRLLSERLAVI